MTRVQSHIPAPLRLHWWKGAPNFGDALSALVVAHMSGREVAHAGPKSCEMVAIGSLLQVMQRNFADPATGSRPVVWGTGLLHPVPMGFVGNLEIALLRGPVTAALLGIQTRQFGDPGLLIPDVLGPRPDQRDRIALVPHHSMADHPACRDLAARHPVLDLIDVRDRPEAVCARIASCRHVLSSSLHGLVLADAYGVPSTWLDPEGQSRLKYLDYAASVGRPLTAPLPLTEVPMLLTSLPDHSRLAWAEGIARSRSDLIETFPAWLRAVADTPPAARRA